MAKKLVCRRNKKFHWRRKRFRNHDRAPTIPPPKLAAPADKPSLHQ
ncbi:MAG TPA: hypothetical protein VFX17_00490 [Patescibacteria group bacterium]|nr:hypothetical protein [Patescibacteria group bacterium]